MFFVTFKGDGKMKPRVIDQFYELKHDLFIVEIAIRLNVLQKAKSDFIERQKKVAVTVKLNSIVKLKLAQKFWAL